MKNSISPQVYTETKDYASACACFNLRKAARAMTNLYDEYLRPVGLSITQLTLLMVLEQAKEISISRLAELIMMDRTTLTRDLKPLERRGLIQISEGEDRRQRLISLTSEGHHLLEKAIPQWKLAQTRFLERFGVEQFESFLGQLMSISNINR